MPARHSRAWRLWCWMGGNTDYSGPVRPMYDWMVDHVTYDGPKLIRVFCIRGHTPEDDHCGRPEHRFCLTCGTPTPFAEISDEGV